MGQYPINNVTNKWSMGQYPMTTNVKYTFWLKVSWFSAPFAQPQRNKLISKHPFEVGFDDNATCTQVHPPPINHPTIGDGVTTPPQIVTADQRRRSNARLWIYISPTLNGEHDA